MSRKSAKRPLLFGGRQDQQAIHWLNYDEFIKTPEAFSHWIASVWVNEHDVPTGLPALIGYDIELLRPEYEAYLRAGKHLPERPLSVQELWLLTQLGLRTPITCLLNSAQPEQPVERIRRLRRLPAAGIWDEFKDWYANPTLDRPLADRPAAICPTQVLVYDGDEVAHVISAYTIWENKLHYADPWPGRSLLCAENNAAGVSAQISDLLTPSGDPPDPESHHWSIMAGEFQKVVFAVFLYPIPPVITGRPIELTKQESQEAERESTLMEMLRQLNQPAASSGVKDQGAIPGSTPLSELEAAVSVGQMWRVKVALNHGADVNEKGTLGTPLQIAADRGDYEIVRFLVERGADYRALDSAGKTAAQRAADRKHSKVARYLQSYE
jgi:hypothetical protein